MVALRFAMPELEVLPHTEPWQLKDFEDSVTEEQYQATLVSQLVDHVAPESKTRRL